MNDRDEIEETETFACRKCGCRHLVSNMTFDGRMKWGRTQKLRTGIRRTKFCRNCGSRVITFESIQV